MTHIKLYVLKYLLTQVLHLFLVLYLMPLLIISLDLIFTPLKKQKIILRILRKQNS